MIYVGCDEDIFYPRPPSSSPDYHQVFYYSSFLPLHGTEVILQAAHRLRNRREIQFILGGDGPKFREIQRATMRFNLENVRLVGWIPLKHLPNYIAEASICLGGHFSTIPKAARVISTKTFQFLAMRRPTIVGDNEATRELFVHREHVYAVPMGDAVALADAIGELIADESLRDRIAEGGHAIFRNRLTIDVMGSILSSLIGEMV